MYELLVLALLMHWPLYAYLIAEIANHILGPWERISRGTLSSLLTKLEQAGLITPADPAQVPFPTDRVSDAEVALARIGGNVVTDPKREVRPLIGFNPKVKNASRP